MEAWGSCLQLQVILPPTQLPLDWKLVMLSHAVTASGEEEREKARRLRNLISNFSNFKNELSTDFFVCLFYIVQLIILILNHKLYVRFITFCHSFFPVYSMFPTDKKKAGFK